MSELWRDQSLIEHIKPNEPVNFVLLQKMLDEFKQDTIKKGYAPNPYAVSPKQYKVYLAAKARHVDLSITVDGIGYNMTCLCSNDVPTSNKAILNPNYFSI